MSQLVAKNHIVTLDYHVTDPDGEVVDEGREALVYLHGGYDDIFPKIEEALHGKSIGESVQVKLQPDEAFGAAMTDWQRSSYRKRRCSGDRRTGLRMPRSGEDRLPKVIWFRALTSFPAGATMKPISWPSAERIR